MKKCEIVAFVTKWALSRGILRIRAYERLYDNGQSTGAIETTGDGLVQCEGRDWHRTEAQARIRVDAMVEAEKVATQRKLSKLKKFKVEIVDHTGSANSVGDRGGQQLASSGNTRVWVKESLVVGAGWTSTNELYGAYLAWATDGDLGVDSEREFQRVLTRELSGYHAKRDVSGYRVTLKLREPSPRA